MARRAVVELSLETIAGMLHLREGLRVTGARYEADTETVKFYLGGESLPECSKRSESVKVPLASVMDWEIS